MVKTSPESSSMPDKCLDDIEVQLRLSGSPCTILRRNSFMHSPFAGARIVASECKTHIPLRKGELKMVDA